VYGKVAQALMNSLPMARSLNVILCRNASRPCESHCPKSSFSQDRKSHAHCIQPEYCADDNHRNCDWDAFCTAFQRNKRGAWLLRKSLCSRSSDLLELDSLSVAIVPPGWQLSYRSLERRDRARVIYLAKSETMRPVTVSENVTIALRSSAPSAVTRLAAIWHDDCLEKGATHSRRRTCRMRHQLRDDERAEKDELNNDR
jgi:hypothetical protein